MKTKQVKELIERNYRENPKCYIYVYNGSLICSFKTDATCGTVTLAYVGEMYSSHKLDFYYKSRHFLTITPTL